MKKTYQTPETLLTVIELQAMIAASPFTKNDQTGDLEGGELQNENATGAALSRYNVWGDEDELLEENY